jgi:hypothetical protein
MAGQELCPVRECYSIGTVGKYIACFTRGDHYDEMVLRSTGGILENAGLSIF